MPAAAMSDLLLFYYGSHPDHRGRLLAEILRQDDFWLEITHDYIQWIFPLTQVSAANRYAPLLDGPTIKAFRSDALLQSHLRAAVGRFVRFLGLEFDGTTLRTAANWNERRHDWFDAQTHNSLRITRMLKCMTLLGLEDEARALFAGMLCLCQNQSACGIPDSSLAFWRLAVGQAAVDEDSTGKEPRFR